MIGALKSEALLNKSVGAGYIDRNWPPAFKDAGAWPLASLRQSFLTGGKKRGGGGGSGKKTGRLMGRTSGHGSKRCLPPDEVAFEADVFLLTKAMAELLRAPRKLGPYRARA